MKYYTIPALAVALSLIAAPATANNYEGHKRSGEYHFSKADANKDGVITRAEFNVVSDRMFSKLDMNKDGRITRAEAKEAKQQWKMKHKDMHGKMRHMYHNDGHMHRYYRNDAAVSDAVLHGENAPRSNRVLDR